MIAIRTDRLILRRFRPDDAADLFAYLHRPRARCFLSSRLDTPADAEAEAGGAPATTSTWPCA